jgi:PIN domain nuclease of toxin-antitoxin system
MSEQEADQPERPRRGPQVRTVLDASAILALLFGEPGAETVADAIADGAAVSTVTHAEVGTVLIRSGNDHGALALLAGQVRVEPFTETDANTAAALIAAAQRLGLSLGDRACLALAKRLGVHALTAEQAWAQLQVDIEITLIRSTGPLSGSAEQRAS